MGLLLRILSICTIGGLFIGLLLVNFFPSTVQKDIYDIENILQSSVQEDKTFIGQNIYHTGSNIFEDIYSNRDDIKIDILSGSLDINISKPGLYLSSFRDFQQTYTFSGKDFIIQQEGIGEIFIDTQSTEGKILVFPITTSVHIILRNEETLETYSDIFLTPHMYLEFDPIKGPILKNADALRVQTVYSLGFLGEDLSHIFENQFFQKYQNALESFFIPVFQYIQTKDEQQEKVLDTLMSQDLIQIPGYTILQKYKALFVNQEKKKVVYKNIILQDFLKLLASQSYNEDSVMATLRNIEYLKTIDKSSYDQILKLEQDILFLLLSSNKRESIPSKVSFLHLSFKEVYLPKLYFGIYSNVLFSDYEENKVLSSVGVSDFLEAFRAFVVRRDTTDNLKNIRFQYFTYFLEHQLNFLLSQKKSTDSMMAILDTLENYINLSAGAYDASSKSKITLLYIYNTILRDLNGFLRDKYFLPERSSDQLLILSDTKFLAKDVSFLSTLADKIFTIYQNDKKFLNKNEARDIIIINGIEDSMLHLKEYISALGNYQGYVASYDISKQDLRNLGNFGELQNETLTQEKIIKYLEQFAGLDLSNIQVQVNADYYHIDKVYIGGKNFSFDIYPVGYRMENIIIDGQKSRFVYKLGEIEADSGKKDIGDISQGNTGSTSESDFKKFFLNSFFQQTEDGIIEYVNDTQITTEDKTEIVFKRDVLLGDNGEFSKIRSFFPVKYENITIVKVTGGYDIFLSNINMQISSGSGFYDTTFLSSYVFSKQEHFFKDISLNISSLGTIIVSGKIDLVQFQDVLGKIALQTSYLQQLILSIKSENTLQNQSIQYTVYNKKMIFKFDSLGKKYTISLTGGQIEKIYVDNTNVISAPIDIKDINLYIR